MQRNDVGSRVRAIRKKRGLTIANLAKGMDISRSYLSELENGDKRWNVDQVLAAATALEVDPYLLQDSRAPIDLLDKMSPIISNILELQDESLEALLSMTRLLRQSAD